MLGMDTLQRTGLCLRVLVRVKKKKCLPTEGVITSERNEIKKITGKDVEIQTPHDKITAYVDYTGKSDISS
jgi:hypothetical protein